MEKVTKEAIEAGRKVYIGKDYDPFDKAVWIEAPNGNAIVAAWGKGWTIPSLYFPRDLTLVPEPERREVWLNVYPDNDGWLYATKEQADKASGPSRLGPAIRVPLISTDGVTWEVDWERRNG